jgi:hypothetical protein
VLPPPCAAVARMVGRCDRRLPHTERAFVLRESYDAPAQAGFVTLSDTRQCGG